MNYDEFLELIREDNINSSYIFMGEEIYLIDEGINKLKSKYIDQSLESINFIVLDGKETNFDSLVNACETLPFMSPKKIVVLNDIQTFIEREEPLAKNDIYNYLENLGFHVCLILRDSNGDLKKNSKLYRTYNKNKKLVDFSKLKGKDLNLWIQNQLSKYNKKMSFANINYFTQRSSYFSRNISTTLYDLENELKKIINFTKGNEITKEEIDLVLAKSLDNNIFDLLSAVNNKDIDKSLTIFNEMYLSNEPVQRILFMLTRQIRLLLSYKLYREKGYNPGEIQDKLQIKPYEFNKISSQTNSFTINQLEDALDLILNVDKKLKTTSSNDKLEMEVLLVKLSRKIKL